MRYKELIEDYNEGLFKIDNFTLMIGSNGAYWECTNPDFNQKQKSMSEKIITRVYGVPFKGNSDLVQLLNAIGIKAKLL